MTISEQHVKHGSLMIVGGAEKRRCDSPVFIRFLEFSTSRDPTVLLVDAASRAPGRMVREYRELFMELGARKVLFPRLVDRDDADQSQFMEAVEEADIVYLSGGDQSRLVGVLLGTKGLRRLLHRHRNEGLPVGGSSAGAAALSRFMIAGGRAGLWPKKGRVRLSDGLGFAHELVIDQHFGRRARLGRLLEALAILSEEDVVGIGVDEDTAVAIGPDGRGEVVGRGAAMVLRMERGAYREWCEAEKDEIIGGSCTNLLVLRHGDASVKLRANPPRPAACNDIV